jgi:hypothetical protein
MQIVGCALCPLSCTTQYCIMHPASCTTQLSPASCTTQHAPCLLCFIHCVLHNTTCTLLAVLYALHLAPYNMQIAGCALRPSSCTTQYYALCLLHHTTCNLPPTPHNTHSASCTTQHAPCRLSFMPFILHHTKSSLLVVLSTLAPAPHNMQAAGCALCPTSCTIQHAPC